MRLYNPDSSTPSGTAPTTGTHHLHHISAITTTSKPANARRTGGFPRQQRQAPTTNNKLSSSRRGQTRVRKLQAIWPPPAEGGISHEESSSDHCLGVVPSTSTVSSQPIISCRDLRKSRTMKSLENENRSSPKHRTKPPFLLNNTNKVRTGQTLSKYLVTALLSNSV